MVRIIKLVILLVILGFIGLVGFAYIDDLRPQRQSVTQPVTLDVD